MPTPLGRRARPALSLAALLLAGLTLAAPVRAQVCTGDVVLSSQMQVDNFNCTSVTGGLFISGNDIVDLGQLSELTSVGHLSIIDNASLTSLNGLSGLTSVGGNLFIGRNASLASLEGLAGLTSDVRGHLFIIDNASLTSLDGLSGLTRVFFNLIIENNAALTSLDGLSGLTFVRSFLVIRNNAALTSLDGLSGLTSVGEDLTIVNNAALTSVSGLSGLTSVRVDFFIQSNAALTSLDGLAGLTSVGGDLFIGGSEALSTCSCGLAGLISGDPPAFSGVGFRVFISGGGTCTSPAAVLANPCATTAPDAPPVANAGPDQTVIAGQTVTLDGSASSDPDNDDLTYAWTLNGPGYTNEALTGASPMFCAASAGPYTASLVVHDGTDPSDPDAVTVTAITPTAALDGLAAAVASLRAAGVLNQGQARGLTNNLTSTQRHLARGNTNGALGTLSGFRNQALSLWQNDGVLTEAQARALAGPAGAVLGVLAGPCSAGAAAPVASSGIDQGSGVPTAFALAAAYPNPLRASATLSFAVAEAAHVRVVVYDVQGREVAVLAEGRFEASRHEVVFDAADLPSGTYLVRMTTEGGFSQTQRVTVLR